MQNNFLFGIDFLFGGGYNFKKINANIWRFVDIKVVLFMEKNIFSGKWGKCHCQGVCMDTARKYVYYSFTTKLVKTDLQGNIIGSVDNIVGHLGCMDFNDNDGKVYASLEYKNDVIGRGILATLGLKIDIEDAFYVAIFDVDKIDRLNMDAETDGIMKAVYLKEVVDDFKGKTVNGGKVCDHVLGCSGIDGLTIGKDFGADKGSKDYLSVCYGIYSDVNRTDNDYQVILQYDCQDWWDKYAKPLNQNLMHKSGPNAVRNKYFVYTGNTTYGIQNLEYDAYTGNYFVMVYKGKKPQFPNYYMYVIDGSKPATKTELIGFEVATYGKTLSLVNTGLGKDGIYGIEFPLGSMGTYSVGDGHFYFVDPIWEDMENLSVNVVLYKLVITDGVWGFEKV